jgi:hypothetical protein
MVSTLTWMPISAILRSRTLGGLKLLPDAGSTPQVAHGNPVLTPAISTCGALSKPSLVITRMASAMDMPVSALTLNRDSYHSKQYEPVNGLYVLFHESVGKYKR